VTARPATEPEISALSTASPFDVCGPLPTGTTVLEASAGTGKTFTIAALATRYVAEGVADLAQLMLVTFGRAATQELRQRVRERLSATERALADPATARISEDALIASLAGVSDDEVRLRHSRLVAALADFDAATIATTHGFCQQMLAGLGVAADIDRDAVLLPDPTDLVDEIVEDLYLAKYAASGAGEPALSIATARTIGRRAVADRQAVLAPADAPEGSEAATRFAFARAVRLEFDRRKRASRLLDYDDLLIRLREALADPAHGSAARQRLRNRYRIVLVDEFQDTDPVQWEVLRLAFHGQVTLVLIGDPKQAIYAFRGADVVTYLDAAGAAGASATLARNWRSDQGLLDGLAALFHGAALGDPRITVRDVDAAHTTARLHDSPGDAPVRIRVVPRPPSGDVPKVGPVRTCVAADVAREIVVLLSCEATLTTRSGQRAVRPGDIAVLVRTNDQAALVREALATAGVPAVLSGLTSVFTTAAADEWLTLLLALEQPHRAGRVCAAALTDFLGWSATDLALHGDAALDQLGPLLRGWADVLARRGVAALLETMTSAEMQRRILQRTSGERRLTDLRHLGQALHAAALAGQLGIAALVEWLQHRMVDARDDTDEERSRRLESDADAVQVATVHGSKGLEFPIVYVPYAWDRWRDTKPEIMLLHADDGTRTLDVGGRGGPQYAEHRTRNAEEESGEDLRLFYVAMTRARCRVVMWWAPATTSAASAASRLLLGDAAPGSLPPSQVKPPSDEQVQATLTALADRSSGTIVIEPAGDGPVTRWQPRAEPSADLQAAPFGRHLDMGWRRTSYTALTASAHDPDPVEGVASEPEDPDLQDEPADAAEPIFPVQRAPLTDADASAREVLSPFQDLPSGAAFGTLVHGILERVDTSAADLTAEIRLRCTEALAARLSSIDADVLSGALDAVVRTPLGAIAGQRSLGDIPSSDRLAELEFELPLAGGDGARASQRGATLGDIAALLKEYLPAGDPLVPYASRLADLDKYGTQRLRGYLTGSLDAVLRITGDTGRPQYVIVDYKTNWLGRGDGPLTAWHYRPSALIDAVLDAHYPLQFLLYLVALHRYLRWRSRGYEPDRDLGGVLYLFLRGMCGPQTPVLDGQPAGIFGWRPPSGLVPRLSALLDGSGR
jgi:exodeoxyribonuclease V beta subunit